MPHWEPPVMRKLGAHGLWYDCDDAKDSYDGLMNLPCACDFAFLSANGRQRKFVFIVFGMVWLDPYPLETKRRSP